MFVSALENHDLLNFIQQKNFAILNDYVILAKSAWY